MSEMIGYQPEDDRGRNMHELMHHRKACEPIDIGGD